jgi:hypothetical protein
MRSIPRPSRRTISACSLICTRLWSGQCICPFVPLKEVASWVPSSGALMIKTKMIVIYVRTPFPACSSFHRVRLTFVEIIFRKSDVRKKGKTRGWEIMLSYSFRTAITTGYVKGTPSSDIVESIKHLGFCRSEVGHPLLLPMIILSYDLSFKSDIRQREARDWLRRLENAITMRDEIEANEVYKDFDVDGINRDLVECHSQVLWKRPAAYKEIVAEVKEAMGKFKEYERTGMSKKELRQLHGSMLARLEFYKVKLSGMEHYAHTTLERLHIQRQAVSFLLGYSKLVASTEQG